MPIPGPAPKPPGQKRRRNAPTFQTTKIPAAGRGGAPAPDWPSGVTKSKPTVRAGKALISLWEELWQQPQAYMWERMSLERTVARYIVMLNLQASDPTNELKKFASEVRMMEDRLGLNAAAMLKLRWEIDEAELEDAGDDTGGNVVQLRRRVKAADTEELDDDVDDD